MVTCWTQELTHELTRPAPKALPISRAVALACAEPTPSLLITSQYILKRSLDEMARHTCFRSFVRCHTQPKISIHFCFFVSLIVLVFFTGYSVDQSALGKPRGGQRRPPAGARRPTLDCAHRTSMAWICFLGCILVAPCSNCLAPLMVFQRVRPSGIRRQPTREVYKFSPRLLLAFHR